MKQTCDNCRYAVMQDVGYSNYTVEGTEFSCLKKLHPDGEFDRWYGEEPRLGFAAKCDGYRAGTCIELDVDGEWETGTEAADYRARMAQFGYPAR